MQEHEVLLCIDKMHDFLYHKLRCSKSAKLDNIAVADAADAFIQSNMRT